MNELTRDGTAEPFSQARIPRRDWRQGKMMFFPCLSDLKLDEE